MATIGNRGDCRCRRSSTCRSGSLAGATIEVWKAWLTGNGDHVVAGFQEDFHGLLDGLARAADHRLAVAVDVGDHHVAVDRLQDSLDFFERRKDRGHPAVVFHRHSGHSAAAGADGFQRILEGKGAGRDQRAVFAQAVSHGHVGLDAVSGQQPGQRQIGGQHGRLSDRGLAQILFGLGDGVGVGLVDEDELAERLAEQGRHDAVGFGKGFGHDRFGGAERLEHVDVLRALAGIQERHLGRGTVAAEDALRAQSFPDRRPGWPPAP